MTYMEEAYENATSLLKGREFDVKSFIKEAKDFIEQEIKSGNGGPHNMSLKVFLEVYDEIEKRETTHFLASLIFFRDELIRFKEEETDI